MLFTSLVFGLFLPIVFAAYWLIYYPKQGCEVSSVRLWIQNLLVVVASYVFYGWWNWKFLLLFFSRPHGRVRAACCWIARYARQGVN